MITGKRSSFQLLAFGFLLLASSLQPPASAFAEDRDASMQQARQLSWEKHYDEAVLIYERLLKDNPRDIEASLGLAGVTAWKGDHAGAQRRYEALLKDHPENREALAGLARVLFWQGKHEESVATYDELLAQAPDDEETLKEKQKVLDAKESVKPFRARAGYRFEHLNFAPDAHGTGFLFSYEKPKKWTVRGGFNYIDKFGDSAPGFTVGAGWWAARDTVLSLDVESAPGQVVVPRQAYTFEISQTVFKKLVPSISYRFADYSTANAHIAAPGLTWYFYPRLDWMARYFLSVSRFGGQNFVNHSMMTRLNWNLIDALSLFAGYSRANESFESGNPVNPTGGFSADHVFAGFKWNFYRELGADFTVDAEKRNNGATLQTYDAGLFYRW